MAGRLPELNQWVYDYNLFANQVGDLGNIRGGTGIPARANGTLSCISPTFGPDRTAQLSYTPESGTANNYGHGQTVISAAGNNPSSLSIGIVYNFDVGLSR